MSYTYFKITEIHLSRWTEGIWSTTMVMLEARRLLLVCDQLELISFPRELTPLAESMSAMVEVLGLSVSVVVRVPEPVKSGQRYVQLRLKN